MTSEDYIFKILDFSYSAIQCSTIPHSTDTLLVLLSKQSLPHNFRALLA